MRNILFSAAGLLIVAGGILISADKFSQTPPLPENGTANLSGKITETGSGLPVPDAHVTLTGTEGTASVITDSAGTYYFEKVPAGEYVLEIKAAGYAPQNAELLLPENSTITWDVALSIVTEDQPDIIVEEIATEDVKDEVRFNIQQPAFRSEKKTKSMGNTGAALYSMEAADYDGEYGEGYNTEAYNVINENGFKKVIGNALSTFSIDVDNASYSNIRRFINYGQTPPKDAVRIEEMVNYFDYTYAQPKNDDPFAINYEMSECPWNKDTRLVMIGLQGKDIDYTTAEASNLVFLIDVSGSMQDANKLGLVKSSLKTLVDNLNEKDRVALVVYAGAAGEVLPSTSCNNKQTIKNAIDQLEAGGSTAGGAGIQLAYSIAIKNFIKEGNNRVILCTDGDFNVGASSDGEMTRLIEEKRKSGVFITVCGFGMGNYKDSKMESIADAGNGSYYYIDSDKEAKKVFTTDMRGTLFTIAKDVKIQVEFNPAIVEEYRLIGYENRLLNKEDFDDDTKDAGELGAGHRVTALYEIKMRRGHYQPSGPNKENNNGEDLKYQTTEVKATAYNTDEVMTLKLRYKAPDGETSKLIERALTNSMMPLASTSDNFRWAGAVVEFGMLLRDSEFKGDAGYEEVIKLANSAIGDDKNGYRKEFIGMVKTFTGFAQQK